MELVFEILREDIQTIAVYSILFVFAFALLGINSANKTLNGISKNGPTILTSLGIFFTFLGISMALQDFDVSDINLAIPKLLDGLKLAFISSVFGLGAGLVFRFVQPGLKKASSTQDATASDLLSELRELNANTISVKDALIGEGDSSLSTQMGKLRNDFRDFAEKVSEDSSKALVEALEEVIRDFNTKISEQFGENFKQLNEAVGALLEWQKEYRIQLEQLIEAYKESQKGIDSVRVGVEKIEESTQKIPEQMDTLEKAFDATESRVEQLYEGLASLSKMRENAEEAVPFIKDQLEGFTDGLKSTIDSQLALIDKELSSMNDLMSSSLDSSEKMYAQQMEKFQGVLDSLNMGADAVLDSTQKVGDRVEKMLVDFNSDQAGVSREIKRRIDESLSENTETMNQSFQALDQGMQEQLQRSLDKMGNNLTSITERLVQVYSDSGKRIASILNEASKRVNG